MTEQREPSSARHGYLHVHSPPICSSALFAGAGRFRWAAQRGRDKDQRNLDNSRVLWRRNLEQNRRDVVRNWCTAKRCVTGVQPNVVI